MRIFCLLVLLALLVAAAPVHAATVRYSATDLADPIPGQDLWQYTYTVSDFVFGAGFGFSVFFAEGLYAGLEDPPPGVNADWDILVVQPDPGLPDDGFYDALALVPGARLVDPFTVGFVWLGPGTPGAQPFSVHDAAFATLEEGLTVVPEPTAALLLGLGIGALGGAVRVGRRGAGRSG